MGRVLHYPTRRGYKALKAEIRAYCKPHGIEPKQVVSITVNAFPEPKHLIEFFNNDGNFCTIEVIGEFPEEKKPKRKD